MKYDWRSEVIDMPCMMYVPQAAFVKFSKGKSAVLSHLDTQPF